MIDIWWITTYKVGSLVCLRKLLEGKIEGLDVVIRNLRDESFRYIYLNRTRLKYKEGNDRLWELQVKVCSGDLKTDIFNLLSLSIKLHILWRRTKCGTWSGNPWTTLNSVSI